MFDGASGLNGNHRLNCWGCFAIESTMHDDVTCQQSEAVKRLTIGAATKSHAC
jgi:hypothetical protein